MSQLTQGVSHFDDVFSANILTGAKLSALSTNHLNETNKNKHYYNQEQQNHRQPYKKTKMVL